jgi:predicted Zn-dependent protease with MMP-like domain
MTDEEFQSVVEEAIGNIPEEFREKIENIDIIIEDYPAPETLKSMKVSKNGLLGLYTGIPHSKRSPFFYGNTLPDRIYLFKKNLEAFCKNREELKEQIQRTVLHELGHYFGISDQRLRELGF